MKRLLQNENNGKTEKSVNDNRKKNSGNDGLKKVSSAAGNMSALIDDIVKKARKNFRETGKPDVDGKFLKESVGALKELYELLEESEAFGNSDNGVFIRFDDKTEEWGG